MPSPELIQQARELLQLLIRYHIQSEQQYIWYILLSVPVGMLFFLVLTYREQAAHLSSIWDKLRFFFSPYAPESFLVVLDSYGWHVGYHVQLIPGKRYYIIRFKGKEYRVLDDPLKWAVPSSLLDMKGPSGVPSPFGLVARLIVAWMIVLIASTYAFTQTAYISFFAYGIEPTWIDVLSVAWFTAILAWFLRNTLELHRSTGLVLELWTIPPTNIALPAATGPRSLREWKELLARSIDKAATEKGEACKKLAEKLEGIEDEEAAAQLVAMARDAEIWRMRYAELEEQLDKHVEAAEAAALRAGQPTRGFYRLMPWIMIAAILLAVIAVVIALQPSIHPVYNTTTAPGYTPAHPPPPTHSTPSITPAHPPPPPT